jgi:hypothetical protein
VEGEIRDDDPPKGPYRPTIAHLLRPANPVNFCPDVRAESAGLSAGRPNRANVVPTRRRERPEGKLSIYPHTTNDGPGIAVKLLIRSALRVFCQIDPDMSASREDYSL